MTNTANEDRRSARQITTTTIDLDELTDRFAAWLQTTVGADATPTIVNVERPAASGMSSITILFDASWFVGGVRHDARLVARLPPEATSFPVFPTYDLSMQYDVMRAVGEHSAAPVPPVRWLEPSPEVLGRPFIVMERVDGRVPVDNPPYVFGGWLYDATDDERAMVQHGALEMLVAIHGLDAPAERIPSLAGTGDDALRAHVDDLRAYYEWTYRDDGMRIPLLDAGFQWIDDHWPADPGPTVLSWGDARIGNIIFDEFTPKAVVDWEMAALGPPEIDLGWMIFLHRFFQDLAEGYGFPGLPGMFRRDDVIARYHELSGYEPRDMDFYIVYAALRHGVVMSQVKRRSVHFGEDEAPTDPDDYVHHRASLERLLDGTYWSTL